jgi:hypothetical protein
MALMEYYTANRDIKRWSASFLLKNTNGPIIKAKKHLASETYVRLLGKSAAIHATDLDISSTLPKSPQSYRWPGDDRRFFTFFSLRKIVNPI